MNITSSRFYRSSQVNSIQSSSDDRGSAHHLSGTIIAPSTWGIWKLQNFGFCSLSLYIFDAYNIKKASTCSAEKKSQKWPRCYSNADHLLLMPYKINTDSQSLIDGSLVLLPWLFANRSGPLPWLHSSSSYGVSDSHLDLISTVFNKQQDLHMVFLMSSMPSFRLLLVLLLRKQVVSKVPTSELT